MECNNCDRKTPDRNYNNRNIESRGGCSEKNDCGSGRNVNCNMSRNSNYNMNRSTNRNMNRSMNKSMNCNMNRCSNNNMNRSMNCNMNRSNNCNMNRRLNSNMSYNSSRNIANNSDNECNCEMKSVMNEGCDRGNEPVDKMNPGMAFVPWQEWKDVYDMEKGLERGTIFEELDKPYLGRPII